MFLTKQKYQENKRLGKGLHAESPLVQACKLLDGDAFRLFFLAWSSTTGAASLYRMKTALKWNNKKLTRELNALCDAGWAYRVVSFKNTTSGYRCFWILPFGTPLEEEDRSRKEKHFDQLPASVRKELREAKRLIEDEETEDSDPQLEISEGPIGPIKDQYEEPTPGNEPENHGTNLSHSPKKPWDKFVPLAIRKGLGEKTRPAALVFHPEEEGSQLSKLMEKQERSDAKHPALLLGQNPLKSYLEYLGVLPQLSAVTAEQLWNQFTNYRKRPAIFWDLRYICAAKEMELRNFPLTRFCSELKAVAEEARSVVNELRQTHQSKLATSNPEFLKTLPPRLRTPLEETASDQQRLNDKALQLAAKGAPWAIGLPIMPWLIHRWEFKDVLEKDFEITPEEAALALVELDRFEFWRRILLSRDNAAMCEAISGLTQADLNALSNDSNALLLKELNVTNAWLMPKTS